LVPVTVSAVFCDGDVAQDQEGSYRPGAECSVGMKQEALTDFVRQVVGQVT